jgi:hypothetical protein
MNVREHPLLNISLCSSLSHSRHSFILPVDKFVCCAINFTLFILFCTLFSTSLYSLQIPPVSFFKYTCILSLVGEDGRPSIVDRFPISDWPHTPVPENVAMVRYLCSETFPLLLLQFYFYRYIVSFRFFYLTHHTLPNSDLKS